jgi:hypothetical protein
MTTTPDTPEYESATQYEPGEHPNPRELADRPPTADEEVAAEEAADSVDVDTTAEHFEEMNRIGANVEGGGDPD